MAIHKENDWILAKIGNPTMSVDAFEEVGLDATNTSIESEQDYAETQAIQNMPEFQTDGAFDSVKFHEYYTDALADFNQLARDTYAGELKTAVSYYKDDIFAPNMRREQEEQRKAPETYMIKILNPDRKIYSRDFIGQVSDSDKSIAEIMQENQVLLNPDEVDIESGDFSKAKWGKSINDMSLQSSFSEYFKSWGNTYVQARWKEDGVHVDPVSGVKTQHKKGQPKLNPNGDYYYEIANGRDIAGEQVLSRWDYLTVDGTKANTFDFMDSDDKQKSWEGTLAREVFEIAPLFIPYVGTAYMALRLSSQLGSLAATAGKMLNDNFDFQWKWTNSLEAFNKSLELGTSEYSQQNSFTAENLISMAGQVGTQLLEQRFLFKAFAALGAGGKNLYNEKTLNKLRSKYRAQYLENAKGAEDIQELVVLSNKYAESEIKALQRASQYFGEEASRLWMTGYTVMDAYNEARENGATDLEAALLTMGYSAMEYGILRTDIGRWILPELKYERMHLKNMLTTLQGSSWKESLNLVDPTIKTNKLKSLFKKGAKACKLDYMSRMSSNPSMRDLVSVMASNALGEGVEETTEELAYDVSRAIGNAVATALGSDTDFKPFEHGFERYSMSFLGGMFGGAVAQADPSFLKALKFDHNMTYDHAFKEFVGMIGEGKAEDLKKMIKKLPINNQFLTKTNPQVQAVTMQDPQGDINDNMDKQSKKILLDMVDFCQNILDKHDANLTQSQLLRQSTYLKDLQADALANSSFAAGFVRKFNDARTELIKAEIEYAQIASPALNDATDRNADDWVKDHKDQIAKAKENLEKADVKVKSFFDGTQTPLLVRGVMKEMMPEYIRPYGIGNLEMYAQALFGESYNKLSDLLKNEAKASWEAFKSEDHQDHMVAVDKVTQGMAKIVAPLLQNIQETYLSKLSENPYLKSLREKIEARGRLYGILADEDTLRQELINSTENLEEKEAIKNADYKDLFYRFANGLLSKGAVSESSPEFSLLNILKFNSDKAKLEDIANKAKTILEYQNPTMSPSELQNEIIHQIKNYVGELITEDIQHNTEQLIQESIHQGFIHPEAKSLLLLGLDMTISRNKEMLGGDADYEIETLLSHLEEQKNAIKNLPLIPILSILDKFLVEVQNDINFTISDLFNRVEDILKSPDLDNIIVDDTTYMALQNALHLIDMFNSQILGATVDDINLLNRFSLNKMINDLEEQYGIEDKSNLATISSITAQQIRRDLEPVVNKLKFLQLLRFINAGLHARILNQVAGRGYVIMYNKFVNKVLGNIDKDKWNKDGAYDKLKLVVESLELLKTFLPTDIETVKKMEEQRIVFEDAIYDFMQANDDKSWDEKAQLFKSLKFGDDEEQILCADSEDLSDAHFMYWFMATSLVKGSSFLNTYKNAYLKNPKIAPFAAQEIGIRLLYSNIVLGDAFSNWTKAVRSVIVNYLENLPKEELTNLDVNPKNFWDSKYVPRFFNTILIEGVAGSGKTTGVLELTVAMLKENEQTAKLLKNAWICDIDTDSASKKGKKSGLSNFKVYDRISLMDKITPTGEKYNPNSYVKDGKLDYGDEYIEDEEHNITHVIKLDENIEDLPSIIIIDEVGRFTTDEIKALDNFCIKHGITLVCLGDLNQTKTIAVGKYEGTGVRSTLFRSNFIHCPKLGETVRAENNLKLMNLKTLQLLLKKLITGNVKTGEISLRHFVDDKGFYGDQAFITPETLDSFKEHSELIEKIDLMFRTVGDDEKVGIAYDETDDLTLLEYLENGTFKDSEGNDIPYKDRMIKYPNGASQGKEAKYYIVQPSSLGNRSDQEAFWNSFYTGMSRAKVGCIEIIPSSQIETMFSLSEDAAQSFETVVGISPFKNILSNYKIEDTLTLATIDKVAANRKQIIESVLSEKVDDIIYTKREALDESKLVNPKRVEVVEGQDGTIFNPLEGIGENEPLPTVRTNIPDDKKDIFEVISYSHAIHETGLIIYKNGSLDFPKNAAKRYDNACGLFKILGLKSKGDYINCLENLRNALVYEGDYVTSIKNILGLDSLTKDLIKLTYVKYKVKEETEEGDDAFTIGKNETLLDIFGKGEQNSVVSSHKLGVTIYSEGKPILFIPLLVLPNCKTILSSKAFQQQYGSSIAPYISDIENFINGTSRSETLISDLQNLENNSAAHTIARLLELYGTPQGTMLESSLTIEDLRKYIKPTGPYLDTHEKGFNYRSKGFESAIKSEMMYSLEELSKMAGVKVSEPLISYSGVIRTEDGRSLQYVEPGKPYVLITDRRDVSETSIVGKFREQLNNILSSTSKQNIILNAKGEDLYNEDIALQDRRIKIVYIIPPLATVESYLDNFISKLNKQDSYSIGNDYTTFRLFLESEELVELINAKEKQKVSNILTVLKDFETKILEALDKNDYSKAEELAIQLYNYYSEDNWKRKNVIDIAFANLYSMVVDKNRQFKDDSVKNKIIDLVKKIRPKGIFYNPRVNIEKGSTVVHSDIQSLKNMKIDTNTLTDSEDRTWTVNGSFKSTAFFGNMLPILKSLSEESTEEPSTETLLEKNEKYAKYLTMGGLFGIQTSDASKNLFVEICKNGSDDLQNLPQGKSIIDVITGAGHNVYYTLNDDGTPKIMYISSRPVLTATSYIVYSSEGPTSGEYVYKKGDENWVIDIKTGVTNKIVRTVVTEDTNVQALEVTGTSTPEGTSAATSEVTLESIIESWIELLENPKNFDTTKDLLSKLQEIPKLGRVIKFPVETINNIQDLLKKIATNGLCRSGFIKNLEVINTDPGINEVLTTNSTIEEAFTKYKEAVQNYNTNQTSCNLKG